MDYQREPHISKAIQAQQELGHNRSMVMVFAVHDWIDGKAMPRDPDMLQDHVNIGRLIAPGGIAFFNEAHMTDCQLEKLRQTAFSELARPLWNMK
jgi:hypothetical protein